MIQLNLKQKISAFLLFAVCFASDSNVVGQDWVRKMFQETSHEFGNVTKGEVPEYRFEIQNVYEEDIHISGAFSSCGCTSVTLTKNVLKTWEKGEVICRFNSPSFDGHKQATITVRFDRPFVGEMQLTVSGNIVRGLNFIPGSIDFGQVSDNNLPQRKIQLASSGDTTFRVVDVKSTFPHIKVQLKETSRNGGLVNYEMVTQLKTGVPAGFAQGELYVVVEENRMRREVPIKFTAKIVSELQLPESIVIGPLVPGQEVMKKVLVKADRPFQITDVTCQNTAFRVKADRDAKAVHFVELIYTGENKLGRHECELSFFIDRETQPAGKMKALVEIVAAEKTPETVINSK